MGEGARWAVVFGISVYVIGSAWLATVVARDMDAKGRRGRLYGLGVLLLPPAGLAAWYWARRHGSDVFLNAELWLLAIVTFPLSVIFWLVVMRPWENLRRA